MNPSVISFLYIASALISVYLSVMTYKRNKDALSNILSFLLAAASTWSFFYGFEIAGTSMWFIKLCVSIEYVGIATIPVLWFLYAINYSGNERIIKRKNIAYLYVIPVVTFLMQITNNYHFLFYKSSSIATAHGYWYHQLEPGLFYYVHLVYSYSLILIGVFYIFRMYFSVTRDFRRMISFILVGALIPCIISLLYVFGYKPLGFIDITPFGFLAMGIILMIGVFNNNLFDIRPLALNSLFDSIPDAIFVFNLHTEIINTNPSARNLLNRKVDNVKEILVELVKKQDDHTNNVNGNPDNEIIIGDETYTTAINLIKNRFNDALGKTLILHNISNRKVAEMALKESQEQFKELTEIFPEVIYEADMHGNITYVNEHGLEKFGLPNADYGKLNMLQFVSDQDKLKVITRMQERIAGKKGSFHEYRAVKVNGDEFDTLAYTANIVKDGEVKGIRGFLLDISERKRIEASLRESEINFRTFFETNDDMIFISDNQRQIFYTNSSVLNKLGYTLNELISKNVTDLLPENLRKEAEENYIDILEGKKGSCTLPFERKDGTLIPVETKVWFAKWDGRDCFFVMSKDLTNERAALQKFNKIFDSNPNLMTLHTFDDNKIIEVNNAFLQKTGYSKDESIASSISELDLFAADKRLILFELLHRTGRVDNLEVEIKTKTGKQIPVLVSCEIIETIGKKYYLTVMSDVSEQKQTSELQSLLVKISETYINTPLETIKATINNSLQEIGLFVKADRSYIFDYNWDDNTCNNTYEWCNEGVSAEIENLQQVPLEMLHDWVENHKNDRPMYVYDVEKLDDESGMKQILEPQGIKSLLTIPMMDEGKCIGFVGFDSVLEKHEYTEKERVLLQIFSQMLVNIRNREESNDLLNKQIEIQKLISEISSYFISADISNIEQKIETVLRQTGEFLGVDRSYLLRYSADLSVESNTHEWCAKDISSQKNSLNNVNMDDFPWWKQQVESRDVIYIYDMNELPDEASVEKQDFIRQEIQSIICLPIICNNKLEGLLGFDSVRAKHRWDENQIGMLKVLANTLGDAFVKVQTERELIKAKELAEAASVAKTEFLSNMSHEIRTPLNGVIGFTDLLRNTQLSKIQKDYLDNVITSANSLLGVISDILDFSKIEAGKLELEIVRTDLFQLFENAIDIVKIHASNKGLELLLNIQPDMARYAWVDPIRLKQILVNLMGNAVKFTSKGEVELKVDFIPGEHNKGEFKITIRDTGLGIREEQKDKLFKAFSQADTSTTRRYGGTGLGLIISNSLAQKMGANISFESVYQEGSSFFFSLETNYEYGDQLLPNESLKHIQNVLIIDDNLNNRTILEHTFRYWGINSMCFENGPETINWLNQNSQIQVDLIIVDYHMPYLNGIETIRIIKDKISPQLVSEPIILLHSSLDDSDVFHKAQELNINHMLTKPVKADELYYYLCDLNKANQHINETKLVEQVTGYTIVNSEKRFRILIAEDTRMNMLLITQILKDLIHQVDIVEAENGLEAIEKFKSEQVDLILMDVQMPLMDGVLATKEIRNLKHGKQVPILALSAGVTKEERESCIEVGMNDFLAKPIDKADLIDKLQTYLDIDRDDIVEKSGIHNDDLHFNKTNLLAKIGNDVSLLDNMLNLAKVEYPKYMSEIESAVAERDSIKIRKAAHKLKGSALNMDYNILGELAAQTEEIADRPELIPEHLYKMQQEWQCILKLF